MKRHAFVAMPFGTKTGPKGKKIDFNCVYCKYIKPALEAAGLEVFRADEEVRAGDIRADMFQELLTADLVVADLTLDNPNVWYELGVRHALRTRGVILVQGPRSDSPFDLFPDRKLHYSLKKGKPNPATLKADRAALTAMVQATLNSWYGHKVSPVFALLEDQREPPWRKLLLAGHNEVSEAHKRWERAVETARRKSRPGDILVLADETPNRALWLEAKRTAGECLMELQQYEFALKQFDEALKEDPEDLVARQRRTICLGRVGRYPEARDAAHDLIREFPNDAESRIRLGRVEKNNWLSLWWIKRDDTPTTEMRKAAAAADASLQEAINAYRDGFLKDPTSFYAGINVVTLCHLQRDLARQPSDPDIENLEGAVLWACRSALEQDPKDFWARASLAQLSLHCGPCEAVVTEYRRAVAAADNSSFALDSTRETLLMLQALEFHPAKVTAALQVMQEGKLSEKPWKPEQVLLFSGHMADARDRPTRRFPGDQEGVAAEEIKKVLEDLGAGPGDLALCQGAAGGDLLFIEACHLLDVRTHMYLPLPEPEFIERCVAPSDGNWRQRFFTAREEMLKEKPHIMPVELGLCPKNCNPFERCNLWLLYTALAWGPEKVRFVCLWNGDGGVTAHMMSEVKKHIGKVWWLDTRELW